MEIQRKFASGKWVYTKHAVDRAIERGIWSYEVEEAIGRGEIIEDYPADKYGAELSHTGMGKEKAFAHPG